MNILAIVVGGLTMAAVAFAANIAGLATESFMIPAADAGLQLHVRNKRPDGVSHFPAERIVLFVHGATYPAEVMFDLDLPGGSWAESLARHGYDVYLVDVRGYGRSTRPAAMDAPPQDNPPFATTAEAARDVGAAVDFILKRRSVPRLNLIGASWGCAIMGAYTMVHNDRVHKLVLHAPGWIPTKPLPFDGTGAYRTTHREPARVRSVNGIPPGRIEEISPTAWFDLWWKAVLATDPVGARQSPPALRSPNGVRQDTVECWRTGRSTWEPEMIRVPTLVILAEWDQDCPVDAAREVFARLTHAPTKRLEVIGEGTHSVMLEKNRLHLIQQVQLFLDSSTFP